MKIHVKIQGKTYSVKLGDIQARPIQVEVDGEVFEVWPEESLAPSETSMSVSPMQQISPPVLMAKPSGASDVQKRKQNSIHAPIPGVIVEISVKAGDSVTYGQELLLLEAMKMKNSIRANCDGVIKEVFAKISEHVHQGQILIEFEEEGM